MKARKFLVVVLACILTLSAWAQGTEKASVPTTEPTPKSNAGVRVIPYPLSYCLVTGARLGSMGDPVVLNYKGREFKFCCNACPATFEKNPGKWVKKLNDAIIAEQKPTYPLAVCIVTGDSLSKIAEPVDYIYENRLLRFANKDCVPKFNLDPNKYLKMLDAATPSATDAKPQTPQITEPDPKDAGTK